MLSDGQTSTRQAELEIVLKSYRLELQALKDVLVQERERSYTLQLEGEAAAEEVSRLREELRAEKVKGHDNWEMHCRQLIRWDAEGAERDAEIAELIDKTRLATLEAAGRY